LHCACDELAVGDLVKLSRRHNHAAKLKRESKSEKQFFTFDGRDSERSGMATQRLVQI
jgi:hypothetical protein